ncbi:MAG: glycosyl hydrolase, partial [Polyangiaceae bacterium]
DPDYEDESWIKEKIRLIPRLTEIIAENYPGRGISIGAWNFGAEGHITGAIALAEVLGRFAQGGVTSAYYWTSPKQNSPAYWAFRAFRNFDGRGARFLDKYVEATAPDGSSLFVSKDDSGKHMVAVLLNMNNDTGLKAKIDVSSCGPLASRRTFTYTGHPGGFGEAKKTEGGGTTIEESVAPYSITVIDLSLGAKP